MEKKSTNKNQIKQMNHSFWKPILDQNTELNNYIPFYGVITGKDSIVSEINPLLVQNVKTDFDRMGKNEGDKLLWQKQKIKALII